MEEIIKKQEAPPLPEGILIKYGNWEFNSNEDTEIKDLSDTGVKNMDSPFSLWRVLCKTES